MIWTSNNKWGSKLRQKQAPQNRSTVVATYMGKRRRVAGAQAPGPGITPRFPFTAARTTQGSRTRSYRQTMAM